MIIEDGVRTTDAARLLAIGLDELYSRLFAGELQGGPGPDGLVYIERRALDRELQSRGAGSLARRGAAAYQIVIGRGWR